MRVDLPNVLHFEGQFSHSDNKKSWNLWCPSFCHFAYCVLLCMPFWRPSFQSWMSHMLEFRGWQVCAWISYTASIHLTEFSCKQLCWFPGCAGTWKLLDFVQSLITSTSSSTWKLLQQHLLSGVASGWHGWTMCRGPGGKGGPNRQTKREENEEKKRKGRDRGPRKSIVHRDCPRAPNARATPLHLLLESLVKYIYTHIR